MMFSSAFGIIVGLIVGLKQVGLDVEWNRLWWIGRMAASAILGASSSCHRRQSPMSCIIDLGYRDLFCGLVSGIFCLRAILTKYFLMYSNI